MDEVADDLYEDEYDEYEYDYIPNHNIKTLGERRALNYLHKKKDIDRYLTRSASTYYPFGGWYNEERGYMVYPKNSNLQRYYKRLSNKKIRKNKEFDCSNPSQKRAFHKLFDYWWEVY